MTQARVSFRSFWTGRRVESAPMDLRRAITFAWRLHKRRRVARKVVRIFGGA